MADEEVEFGHVVDLTLGELAGTELVADAAIGATSLVVDYAGDFEEAGPLLLNGATLAYKSITEGVAESDPDVINLVDPLAVPATTDDRVGLMAGGVAVEEWLLHVSLGDGPPVDIPIPFEQRAMWSAVDLDVLPDNPIPVVVSADLERLVEVPGRAPLLDAGTVDTPYLSMYLPADTPIASAVNNMPTAVTGLAVSIARGFDGMDGSGWVTVERPGTYLVTVTAMFLANGDGARSVRVTSRNLAGVETERRLIAVQPITFSRTAFQATVTLRLEAGEAVRMKVLQTSNAILSLLGMDASGAATGLDIAWVAP